MTTDYDLIIVGGGLVGTSLLLALKNTGLKIALVEAQALESRVTPALDQRSLVLSLASKLFYEQLGVWQQIKQFTCPINKIKISEQGVFNKVFLDKTSLGVDALGYVINIQLLNKAIWSSLNLDKTDSSNQIDILCPYELQNLVQTEDNVELKLQKLSNSKKHDETAGADRTDESSITKTCKILIAADGGRSFVRELLSIPYDKHDYKQLALIVNVEHELENHNVAYERFSKQGPFALLPRNFNNFDNISQSNQKNNISGIVWPWPNEKSDQIKNMTDHELLSKLQELFGSKLGKFTKIGQRQFFPLWRVTSKELIKQRVILLGNAANHIHPVGGQGFNLGLRDVKFFTKVLLENKNNLINSNYNQDNVNMVFNSYINYRLDDHYNLTNGTHNLLELFASDKVLAKITRRVGMTVMNHSLIMRSLIADYSMGLATS